MHIVSTGLVIAVVVGLFLVACGGTSPDDLPAPEAELPPEALDKARRAADALTGQLVSTLARELNASGLVGALKVCSETAPEIVASHSTDGVTVRRVSLRVRNPADAPDDYERRMLVELEARHGDGALPEEFAEVVSDGSGDRLRYLRPIVVKRACLGCHGDVEAMDPELRAILEDLYPDDRAVGYREGDFRGAVSVTVSLTIDRG